MEFWYFFCGGESLGAAILFYTRLPWPKNWPVNFDRIARWITLVGIILGTILLLTAEILQWLGMGNLLQAGLLVTIWLGLTGGLHLDGVADSADGLAVTDPAKRLEVMQDSQTGAYGVMAIAVVLLLKTLALASFNSQSLRAWALIMALGWGRWGQLLAIAVYPYVKETGKGAMHRRNLKLGPDLLLGTGIILIASAIIGYLLGISPWLMVGGMAGSAVVTWAVGWWFAQQFGGHTGDIYGAVVEWSEVLILLGLTLV